MFIVILRFSENRSKAAELMEAHDQWLRRGFDDGTFLLAGSLGAREGGAILAHAASRAELESRVRTDPFVARDVVEPEIVEIAPSKADARLSFLLP
jgi:uncharacterized protein YciI